MTGIVFGPAELALVGVTAMSLVINILQVLSKSAIRGETEALIAKHNADRQAHPERIEAHNLNGQAHPNLHGTSRLEEKFDEFRKEWGERIDRLSDQIAELQRRIPSAPRGKK